MPYAPNDAGQPILRPWNVTMKMLCKTDLEAVTDDIFKVLS